MMAAAVTFWIGGFDIFYALQDEAFDRVEGSAISRRAVRSGARHLPRQSCCTASPVVALVAYGAGAGLGIPYYVGVGIGAAIMAYEHQLVKPGDLSRLDAAFFTANGLISVVVFLGALVDRVL